ncbi:MAG: DUF6580 family putative transport protein [Patescibacteria group bacterium]
MRKEDKKIYSFFVPVIVLAFVTRFIPHVPNATSLGALGIVSGRQVGLYKAIVMVLATLFVSDLLIGFYHPLVMASVYGSFALYGLFGKMAKNNVVGLVYASVGAAFSFFFVTNFAVWIASDWYPKTAQGLLSAYALGLPFFRNTLIGDICYTALFGYMYEVFANKRQLLSTVNASKSAVRSRTVNAKEQHA